MCGDVRASFQQLSRGESTVLIELYCVDLRSLYRSASFSHSPLWLSIWATRVHTALRKKYISYVKITRPS